VRDDDEWQLLACDRAVPGARKQEVTQRDFAGCRSARRPDNAPERRAVSACGNVDQTNAGGTRRRCDREENGDGEEYEEMHDGPGNTRQYSMGNCGGFKP
jgi:hypothetical protein